MSHNKHRLVISIEADENEMKAEDASIVHDNDAFTAEVQSKQIDEMTDATSDAVEDLNTLTRIHKALEDILNKDEEAMPDEDTLEIANIATEHCYNSLGIKSKRALPAMESYNTIATRRKAMKLSLISMEGMLGNIWEAIIKALKALWEMIKNFFMKLYGSITSYKEKANKLKEDLKTIKTLETDIEVPSAGAIADTNGKVTDNTLQESIANAIKTTARVKVDIATLIKKGEKLIKSINSKEMPTSVAEFDALMESDATVNFNSTNNDKPVKSYVTLRALKKYIDEANTVLDELARTEKDSENLAKMLKILTDVTAKMETIKAEDGWDKEFKIKIKNEIAALTKKINSVIKIIQNETKKIGTGLNVGNKVVSETNNQNKGNK